MKYGYMFSDWGLFAVVPILTIKEMDEGSEAHYGGHYPKDKYCIAVLAEGGKPMPFLKEHIFDTKEECHKYGVDHLKYPF